MSARLSRRDFLKVAVTTSAAAAFAACTPAAPAADQTSGSSESPKTGSSGSAGKKKLTFSSYTWSGYEAAMSSVLEEWQKQNSDVEIEKQFVPEDYWTKLQTQVASGTPPDVGIADYGRLVSYAKNGTLMSIDNYVSASGFPTDKLIPEALAQYRWAEGEFDSGGQGGKLFGLPSDAQSHIIVYNKTMFEKAGISTPTDDWTWDDVIDAAKALTNPDQNQYGIRHIDHWILMKGNFVWAAGGNIHTPDFSKSLLDSPETMEAFKWSWDTIYTHKVAPAPGALNQTNPFMSGQVGMLVDGVWWISDFVNGIKDFEWDVFMYPKHPKTGKRTTSVESDGWWVFKGTKEPDKSFELLSFLSDQQGQKNFGELNYIIPSAYPDIAEAWYSQTPPANRMKVLDNIVQDSRKVDFTYYEFGTIMNAVSPIIEKSFTDGDDIEATMKEAAQVMNEELEKAWQLFKS